MRWLLSGRANGSNDKDAEPAPSSLRAAGIWVTEVAMVSWCYGSMSSKSLGFCGVRWHESEPCAEHWRTHHRAATFA